MLKLNVFMILLRFFVFTVQIFADEIRIMMNKFNLKKMKLLNFVNRFLKFFFHTEKAERPLDLKDAEQILIIDPTAIGDIVMLIPFIRILRKNAPDAEVTLICGNWAKILLQNQNLVDSFIVIDTSVLGSIKQAVKKRGDLRAVYERINRKKFDIAIEPRGDLRYIFFMHFCRAERKISYNYTGGECLLTDVFYPWDGAKHLVEDKIYLAKKMGCKYKWEDRYPELFLTPLQISENETFKRSRGIEGKVIIGIHPGASKEYKRWRKFHILIEELDIENAVYLIFSGPGEESLAEEITAHGRMRGRGCFHIHEKMENYFRILAVCHMCICNDSGAGHISSAYGIPVVVLFGPFDSEFCRPYAPKGVVGISHKLACKPCLSDGCLTGNNECINRITVEEVKQEVYQLLEEGKML